MAYSPPGCLPKGGHRHRCHIIRKNQLGSRVGRVQSSSLREISMADGYEMPVIREKRLHSDIPESDCPAMREVWGCNVTTATARGTLAEPTKAGATTPTAPKSFLGRGGLPRLGIIGGRQHGVCVAFAPSSFEENVHRPVPDSAEKEAEIRAEILDGARQLLQDESEIDCLVQLRVRLHEKNTALLERAVHRRGVSECMELLREALRVEASGGQLTADGRRRTPGGVFLRLLRDRISHEDKRFIWDEQNREQRRIKRQRIRSRKAAALQSGGALAPAEEQTKTDSALIPSSKQPTIDSECEEREPGELGADEVDACEQVPT